jgi:hypothetical protein
VVWSGFLLSAFPISDLFYCFQFSAFQRVSFLTWLISAFYFQFSAFALAAFPISALFWTAFSFSVFSVCPRFSAVYFRAKR